MNINTDLVRTYLWFRRLQGKVPFDDGLVKGAYDEYGRQLKAEEIDPDKLEELPKASSPSS